MKKLDSSILKFLKIAMAIIAALAFLTMWIFFAQKSSECPQNSSHIEKGTNLKCLEYPGSFFLNSTQALANIATTLGIIIALGSYITSSRTAKITNHIENLNLFSGYVMTEVNKLDRISPVSIDYIFWYNLIFPSSIAGDLHKASDAYIESIKSISLVIENSNKDYSMAPKNFNANAHQAKMSAAFLRIGISSDKLSRIDYILLERELLDLINKVNMSFCPSSFPKKLGEQITYR